MGHSNFANARRFRADEYQLFGGQHPRSPQVAAATRLVVSCAQAGRLCRFATGNRLCDSHFRANTGCRRGAGGRRQPSRRSADTTPDTPLTIGFPRQGAGASMQARAGQSTPGAGLPPAAIPGAHPPGRSPSDPGAIRRYCPPGGRPFFAERRKTFCRISFATPQRRRIADNSGRQITDLLLADL